MTIAHTDRNRLFEFTWRILVFLVAIGIIVFVSTTWTRWEGGTGWQSTTDAYLQSDLTPIAAKVAGYVSALPIQVFDHVRKGQAAGAVGRQRIPEMRVQRARRLATSAGVTAPRLPPKCATT